MIVLEARPEGKSTALSREDSIPLGHDSPKERGWEVCPSWTPQVEVSGQSCQVLCPKDGVDAGMEGGLPYT